MIYRIGKAGQLAIGSLLVVVISAVCFGLSEYTGYRTVALILLFTVSVIAMFFDMLTIVICAVLSAFIWNFFFIPPRFTFAISDAEDILMFIMYFVIGVINAVLTYKIRQKEKLSFEKQEREKMRKVHANLIDALSHELRTPLSVIVMGTDKLKSESGTANNITLTAEIGEAAMRLNNQLENIFAASRIDTGFVQIKKESVNVSELIYETVRKIEANNGLRQIGVNIPQGIPAIKTDRLMLQQIVIQLLENSLKHTSAKTAVDVSVSFHINTIEITVDENGPGFPKNTAGKVFDRLYAAEHLKKNAAGVGLFIVNGYTEALGGSVKAANKTEGGARFVFTLPVK